MTPRERILTALDHREPDRVPVDLGATPSSGISAIAYSNLQHHLGLSGPVRVYDVVQQLAQPDDGLLKRFGVDVLDLGRTFNTAATDWHGTILANGDPAQYPAWFCPERQPDGTWLASRRGEVLALMPPGATFFDQAVFPWVDGYPEKLAGLDEAMSKVLWAAFCHSPWDHLNDADFWATLRARALALRASSDRAIMLGCGCNLFEWGTFLRRLDNFLMDLLCEPEQVEALLDALVQRHLAFLEKVCGAVGDVVDICRFGDDLGMDTGPFMAPDLYRRLFKPRHRILTSYVKTHSRMRPFLHSCGSIYKLLPDLIEAGFEVVNPVQTSSADMDPARLKKEFGRALTFWGGGCDTRRVLNTGTPQQVRDHVRERLEIFTPGGGFVFNPIHNILPDCPPQNIVAMFDAVTDFGR